MKIGGLKESQHGVPGYTRPEDYHEFVLGPGTELSNGSVFREVRQQDQWQLATMTFLKGGTLIVSDERGKDNSQRLWTAMPTNDMPGRGVVLTPLHETDVFFRGSRAHAVSSLMLASGLKPVVAHVLSAETFDRVSVASATKKGSGDVSRWVSLLHGLGLIIPAGAPTVYARTDPEVLSLKSEKERENASGSKIRYRKTEAWTTSFVPQWEEFLKSGLKTMECAP